METDTNLLNMYRERVREDDEKIAALQSRLDAALDALGKCAPMLIDIRNLADDYHAPQVEKRCVQIRDLADTALAAAEEAKG